MYRNFYDLHQARSYLDKTIVAFNNRPFFIKEVHLNDKGYYLYGCYTTTPQSDIKVYVTDKKLSFELPELGFLNFHQDCALRDGTVANLSYSSCLFRIPQRRWKVGIDSKSVAQEFPNILYRKPFNITTVQQLLFSEGLNDLFFNRYPSILDVKKIISHVSNISVSKHFCIDYNGNIYNFLNAKEACGVLDLNSLKPYFENEYNYLKEMWYDEVKKGDK